jgi:hypothetical protein
MATSEAVPADLIAYSIQMIGIEEATRQAIRAQLGAAVERYRGSAIDFGSAIFPIYHTDRETVLEQVDDVIAQMSTLDGWVRTVGLAFEIADGLTVFGGPPSTDSRADGLSTVNDATLSRYVAGLSGEEIALQDKARQYADQLRGATVDGQWGATAHHVASAVQPYLDDPFFAAAFYAELGPAGAQALPQDLVASSSPTGAQDLAVFSHLFGTAVSNSALAPGMAAVADFFLRTPNTPGVSVARAELVSNGSFPPDWLAQAARANALDLVAHKGAMAFDGLAASPADTDRLGQPTEPVAAWLFQLARSPQAAREALATMGDSTLDLNVPTDMIADYGDSVDALIRYGHTNARGDQVAAAYGAAFAAAAGVNDETDGQHSSSAAEFTQDLFDRMGSDAPLINSDGAGMSFAKIAASYIQELAAGRDLIEDQVMGTDPIDRLPGQNPAFSVPPSVVYSVMKSFVGNESATESFDKAAGAAAYQAMIDGARADMVLLAANDQAYQFVQANAAYGTVASAENKAAVDVVGEQVRTEQEQRDRAAEVLKSALELAPVGRAAEAIGVEAPELIWDLVKLSGGHGLDAIFAGRVPDQQRLDDLRASGQDVPLAGVYVRVEALRQAGYPGTDRIPADLLDHNGNMKKVAVVMNDPALELTFYEYLRTDATFDTGHGVGASVATLARDGSRNYDGPFRNRLPDGSG